MTSPTTRAERGGRRPTTRKRQYDRWGENLYYGVRRCREPSSRPARVARVAGAPGGAVRATVAGRRRDGPRGSRRSMGIRRPDLGARGRRSQPGLTRSPWPPGLARPVGKPTRGGAESQARDERGGARRLRAASTSSRASRAEGRQTPSGTGRPSCPDPAQLGRAGRGARVRADGPTGDGYVGARPHAMLRWSPLTPGCAPCCVAGSLGTRRYDGRMGDASGAVLRVSSLLDEAGETLEAPRARDVHAAGGHAPRDSA